MSAKGLRIGATADGRPFTLPVDAVTQAIGVLARRGAGKTYTASVLVEEVVDARQPVCILDPTGAWWGLRSSADGTGAGLPVYIFGGEHGDVPLEPTAGKIIADVVVDHPGAYVLDLSAFESNAAQDRFVADFLERLYRRKAKHPDPLLLVVDEADSFAPQRPGQNQIRMLGAMEAIVRRGRLRGLGVVLISQRAAVLNKNVLTQIEVLVALQTTGPQDRAAIDEWVKANASPDERAAVMDSLASLAQGEAWVWSPAWLRVLARIRIRERRTFNSSATPKAGERPVQPREFAKVDLGKLGAQIAATVEKAKAESPEALHARIRALEAQLAARPAPTVETKVERVEVPVVDVANLDRLRGIADALDGYLKDAAASVAGLRRVEADMREKAQPSDAASAAARVAEKRAARVAATVPAAAPQRAAIPQPPTVSTPADEGPALKAGARRMLATLARHYPMRVSRAQLATLTGMAVSGGTFQTYYSALRRAGFLDEQGGLTSVTAAGMAEAGIEAGQPMTTEEVREQWRGVLKAGARNMLDVAIATYPDAITRSALAATLEMAEAGGTFQTYLSTLRRNGLVEVSNGTVRATEVVMGEAGR